MTEVQDRAQEYARLRDEQFMLYDNYARKNGITSKTLFTLMWIYYNPQGITQETLSKRTFSTKQVIRAIIKNLIDKEYASFEPDPEDGRKKRVKLTEVGRQYASNLLTPLAHFEKETMASLKRGEQERLISLTQTFSRRLKESMEKDRPKC